MMIMLVGNIGNKNFFGSLKIKFEKIFYILKICFLYIS